ENNSDSPEWADTVMKIPRIPAEGPIPTKPATKRTTRPRPETGAASVKVKPVLPSPPPVRVPRPIVEAIEAIPDAPITPTPAVSPAPAAPIVPDMAPLAPPPVPPIPVLDPAPDTATAPGVTVAELPANKQRRKKRLPRRARLHIARVDPWSAMKISFMFSIAFGVMIFAGVYVAWTALESGGLFDLVNENLTELLSNPSDPTPFKVQDYVNGERVMGFTAVIAAVNVIIMTALGTIAAFLYNLASTVIGGIEVTLAED
ncbi:MAG: DUF3566 domain-containing protein, partial [Propionibacteriaceae bacterium]|nr:DUF3566 domain-containing protein [Propionibacteriaceae bacterium]